MKAINYFVLNIIFIAMVCSCKRQEQEAHHLDQNTKAFFEIRNDAKFIFTDFDDTSVSIEYTSGNYTNSRANPDIENSEIMFYDLSASGQASYTIRCQTGSGESNDQIALLTYLNDSIFIGPVIFNQGGIFKPGINSGDSLFSHPSYSFKTTVFTDVIRVKLLNHAKYKEIFFAKKLGLIARREKNNKIFYVKRYRLP